MYPEGGDNDLSSYYFLRIYFRAFIVSYLVYGIFGCMASVKYFFLKFLILVATLFAVITLTFVLMKAIPGDPFMQEQAIPEEILASLHAHYGLDQPLHVQYFRYIKGILTWDLGPSFKYEGRTINDIIREGFPISATLGMFSLMLALFWGILWGSVAAFYRGKWQDRTAMVIAVLGMSVPSFIMATFCQYVFAMKLSLLPIARWDSFAHAILPAIALSAFPMAFIARLTRASMVEVLEKEYILTAKAKGLSNIAIWKRHILKNSLLPVISYVGTLFANIITGSFVVEKIFGIPGLGAWFVNSITNRDYTIILGLTVFYSGLLMITMFLVEFIYYLLDPRIKSKAVQYGK